MKTVNARGLILILFVCGTVAMMSLLGIFAYTRNRAQYENVTTPEDTALAPTMLKHLPMAQPALLVWVQKNKIVVDNTWLMASLGVEGDGDELFRSVVSRYGFLRPQITLSYPLIKGHYFENETVGEYTERYIPALYSDLNRLLDMNREIAQQYAEANGLNALIAAPKNTEKALLDRLLYTLSEAGADSVFMAHRGNDGVKQIEIRANPLESPMYLVVPDAAYCTEPVIQISDEELSFWLIVVAKDAGHPNEGSPVQGDSHWREVVEEINVAFAEGPFEFDKSSFTKTQLELLYQARWEYRPRLNGHTALDIDSRIQKRELRLLRDPYTREWPLAELDGLAELFAALPNPCGPISVSADSGQTLWGEIWQVFEAVLVDRENLPLMYLSSI